MGILAAAAWLLFGASSEVRVYVVVPSRGPAVRSVYATGTVEAEVMLPIATRWAARLVELNVDEGQSVKKSEILAKLESDDLQSSLSAARAKETLAKSEYERSAALLEKQAISRQAFEKSKWDWEAAKAATAQAKAQSSFMSLVAPSDGVVIRRDGEVGQLIPANQPVFWLSSSSSLRITAEVDEEDIALVNVGQAAVIRADAFPGKVYKGKVKSITPKGDPISKSYRVRIELNEETPLQIGMTAETNIIISEHINALLLPVSAVRSNEVWVVRASRLEKRTVSIGASGATQVEIIDGVAPDDLVVIDGGDNLQLGAKVQAKLVP